MPVCTDRDTGLGLKSPPTRRGWRAFARHDGVRSAFARHRRAADAVQPSNTADCGGNVSCTLVPGGKTDSAAPITRNARCPTWTS